MRRAGFTPRWVAILLGVVAATAAILLWMGRTPICTCGNVKLWHGVVMSAENSQHLTDWYTPSHIIHGMLFYGALHLLLPRLGLPPRLLIATTLEAAWEIAENTEAVIQRYREATIALDYFGDSVVNSVADIFAMWLGFALAAKLPVWATVALILVFEIGVGWVIRDGLALNVLMLLWPLESVKAWQAGG
jgi:hypothetical protein